MLLRSCCTVWILILGVTAAAVFVEKREANTVLQRWRRANSGFLEELKQGNLERECIEEICDYEEAREVFEDDGKTRQFWLTYDRRDPCLVNPCKNNGTCLYVETSYECQCPEGFEGRYCQTVFEDSLKCLYQNGHCEHFCDGSGDRRKCSCADGYKLGEDGRQCIAHAEYPCGQVAAQETGLNQSVVGQTRLVGSNHCPRGECPWQVLVQLNGNSHCGGVLINPDWVITAAHCIHGNNSQNLTVVAGEHNLDVEEGTEQRIPVSMAIAHDSYVPASGDSDVALLHLSRPVTLTRHAIPICLPTKDFSERELLLVRYHTVSGWGKRTTGGQRRDPRRPARRSGLPRPPQNVRPHRPELPVLPESPVQLHQQHAVRRVPAGSPGELPWRRRQPTGHKVRLHPLPDGRGRLGAGLFAARVLRGLRQHGQLRGLGEEHREEPAHHDDNQQPATETCLIKVYF
ncbi:uncharacterized protein LOC108877172 [Lates japonicus]